MTWQTFAFLLVAGVAFGYSGHKLSILIKMLKAHRGVSSVRRIRLNDIPARVGETIVNVLGQKAVLRKPFIGALHTAIFWGFIIITIGTLEQFLGTLYRGASFEFIGAGPYHALLFVQDIMTAFVLFGVLGAAYRRFFVRPPNLGQSGDANIILLFTGSLMVAIFLMNAFHILGASPDYAGAYVISGHLANALSGMGLETETYAHLSTLFKWIHMLIVMGFAMYIPSSKHLHVLAAGPNTFLKTLPREKAMSVINFEDESATQYGAAKITDLNWKDALDYYSCTECGRCQEVCPAWNTQKPLSPKKLILDLKHNLYDHKALALAGKHEEIGPIVKPEGSDDVTEDVIWACTSCRACEIACPVFIEQTEKIYDIRRNLVMMESRVPAAAQVAMRNMETNATPWAFNAADRAQWAEGLNVTKMAEAANPADVEVLLWVGCAGSYDERNKKVLRSFSSVLKKAGVKFAILGTEEQCTGDPARRIGNEYLYQTLAKANIETLNRYQVKRVVTACPHCFNTIKNEYKDFGGAYEVFHHSEFLAKLISEGRIKPAKALDETVTFHDSCYLGRWNGIYEQPRDVIGALPSARVVEMKSHHDESMCCGAGGGPHVHGRNDRQAHQHRAYRAGDRDQGFGHRVFLPVLHDDDDGRREVKRASGQGPRDGHRRADRSKSDLSLTFAVN